MSDNTRNFPIADIVIGKRHRSDLGDLQSLADSIREVGLLQRIVVKADGTLVAGARRLLACGDLLGWIEIPVEVADGCPSDAGEWHENQARKNLNPSEQWLLYEKLRSDSKFVNNASPDLDSHTDIALSRSNLYLVKKIRDNGVPELVAAMDAGELSIAAAEKIAAQAPERQREILALPARARGIEVRRLPEKPKPDVERRAPSRPSLKQLEQQWSRFIPNLETDSEAIAASSLSDRKTALAALARIKEAAAQAEAAIDAAPDPKPRRHRRKATPSEEPRCRPRISEADLDRRWSRLLSAAQRARAEKQAAVAAAAVDTKDRDGVNLRAACEAAAQGSDWAGATIYHLILGKSGAAGLADYPMHQWPLVLAPKHSGGSAEADCHPAAWAAFKADFLRREQPTVEMCFRNLQRLAKSEGWTIPLSAAAIGRRLDRELPRAAVVLAREGPPALKRMYPAQIRDRESLRVMGLVCADGHKIRTLVRWPDGKVDRPVLTAWQDIRSGRLAAWRIDRTESSDSYRLAMLDLVREHGAPGGVLLDNSSAAAAIALTGGCHWRHKGGAPSADEVVGLITQLVGPKNIHWALPYSAQSKPIERSFRDLGPAISQDHRLQGAYTGAHPAAKPHYGPGAKPAKPEPVPLALLLAVVADAVREHNARRGRRGLGLDGKSFDEVWAAGLAARADDPPARLSQAQLDRWLLAPAEVTASAESGAVTLHGGRYWSEDLCAALAGRPQAERRVVVRYDPDHLDRPVLVEDREGRLIVRAAAQGSVPHLDTRAARETARAQGRLRKLAREHLDVQNRLDAGELDRLLDDAEAETGPPDSPAGGKVFIGAFDVPAAERPAAVATGTDNLIRRMVDRAIPPIDDEDEI